MKYCVMGYTRDQQYILRFGKRVRELRLAAGHSQEHFANMCDVEASQISRIELGKINTSLSQAIRIAAALNMEMKELFDFDLPTLCYLPLNLSK